MTTTIKLLNEEKIKQTETKFSEMISNNEKNVSDLSSKYSDIENFIKNVNVKQESFQLEYRSLFENLESSIKNLQSERAFTINLLDEKIEQSNSFNLKSLEISANQIFSKELEKNNKERDELLSKLEIRINSDINNLINSLNKDITDTFNKEIHLTSLKIEELNNKIIEDLKQDINHKFENFLKETLKNNVNKQEVETLFDQKLETHRKEILSHIEQEILSKIVSEIDKLRKDHESNEILVSQIKEKINEITQNFNKSLIDMNNLIEGKEEKLFKTFEENKESIIKSIENVSKNIESLNFTDQSIRNDFENLKINYLNNTHSDKMGDESMTEILKMNENFNKIKAQNLTEYNKLKEKIDSMSSEINKRIDLSTENIKEINLSVNKQIKSLTKNFVETNIGNTNEFKELRDNLDVMKREMDSTFAKEKEDFTSKFIDLNKITDNLFSKYEKLEASSEGINICLNDNVFSLERKIEKLVTQDNLNEVNSLLSNFTSNYNLLEQNVNVIKEQTRQNSESIINNKKEILERMVKTNEENENIFKNELSSKIDKLESEVANQENCVDSKIEKIKIDNWNEIQKIIQTHQQINSRIDQEINELSNHFSKNIQQLNASLSNINEKLINNDKQMEIIPTQNEKINSFYNSLENIDNTLKESILRIDDERLKNEEKVKNILNNITLINNSVDDIIVKHDISENHISILSKNIQDLTNQGNVAKEQSSEFSVTLKLIQENMNNTERLLKENLGNLENLFLGEKQNTKKLLDNYILKEESNFSLENLKKDLNEFISLNNISLEEKLNVSSSKINDLQVLFEGKLTENRKSLNKMSESIILENNRLSHRLSEVEKKIENNISNEIKDLDKKLVNVESTVDNLSNSLKVHQNDINQILQHIEAIRLDINKTTSFYMNLDKEILNLHDKSKNLEKLLKMTEELFEKKHKASDVLVEELQKSLKSLSSDLDHYNKNSTVIESNTRTFIQKEITTLNNKIKDIKTDIDNRSTETNEKFEKCLVKFEELSNKIVNMNNELDTKSLKDLEMFKELEEQSKLIEMKATEADNIISLINIKINESEVTLKAQIENIVMLKSVIQEIKNDLEEKLNKQSLSLNDLLMKNKEIEDENNKFDSHFLEEFKDLNKKNTPTTNLKFPNESTFSFSDDEEYAISLKNHLALRNKYNKCETISKSTQIKSLLLKVESYSLLRFKFLFSKMKKYITSQERLEKIIINNLNNKFSHLDDTKQKIETNFSSFNSKVDVISNKIHHMNEYLVLK